MPVEAHNEICEISTGRRHPSLILSHAHPVDRMVDGRGCFRNIPAIVVEGDATLRYAHEGSACVHAGVYTIPERITHSGTIVLQAGSRLVVYGTQSGTVQIHDGAALEIHGAHAGELHVLEGGTARIEAGGRFAGRLEIRGQVENAGVRDAMVTLHDEGTLVDLPGSSATEPDAVGRDRHY